MNFTIYRANQLYIKLLKVLLCNWHDIKQQSDVNASVCSKYIYLHPIWLGTECLNDLWLKATTTTNKTHKTTTKEKPCWYNCWQTAQPFKSCIMYALLTTWDHW